MESELFFLFLERAVLVGVKPSTIPPCSAGRSSAGGLMMREVLLPGESGTGKLERGSQG